MNVKQYLAKIGAKGGKSKSPAKIKAARINAAKARAARINAKLPRKKGKI